VKKIVGFFVCVLFCAEVLASAQQKPNILLIVLDDAGYGDIAGFANSTAPTPTLKQLGDEGVRFTRFYADATCGPARVSLLTGRQASKIAMTPDFYGISPEVETLPEKLKQVGYETYHIGKWHAGDGTRLAWPSAQGFDHWFGFLNQFVLRGPNQEGKFVPRRPTYINPWLQLDDSDPKQYQGHLEDILADAVVKRIHELKNNKAPWFINYWTFAPHNPAVASDVYLKKFPNTPAGKYQALLNQMDDEIGRALNALKETGQFENTMVVVLSDNGGTNEFEDNNGPYKGKKAHYSEGGTRTPMMIHWPKNISVAAAQQHYDGISAIWDIYPTLLAAAGANVTETDGVDLLSLVTHQSSRPPQPFFWETGGDYNYYYSVLSEDGRWRLDDEELYDLQNDPYAEKDIADKQSDKLKELKQLFLDWRKQVHHLNLDTQLLHTEKLPDSYLDGYKVTGDSFRRSPGYGGFTFVTSITPVADKPLVGVVAEQKGMWLMDMTADQRIHVRMNDHEIVSKPVKITECTPLVLSTYYYRSKLQPKFDHGVWVLTLGDKEIVMEKWPSPAVFPDGFMEPTYLGQHSDGSNHFTGKLESPQFYNEFYYHNDPWKVGRDPAWLAKTMCRTFAPK